MTKWCKNSINDVVNYLGMNLMIINNILEEEETMNKTELVAAMVDKTGLTKKDLEASLKAFTEVVISLNMLQYSTIITVRPRTWCLRGWRRDVISSLI